MGLVEIALKRVIDPPAPRSSKRCHFRKEVVLFYHEAMRACSHKRNDKIKDHLPTGKWQCLFAGLELRDQRSYSRQLHKGL